jgi:predicted ATP-dependent serine protease
MIFKCANCGTDIKKKHGLCDDCKKAAAELDRRVQRKTEEEILQALETKPRSWRDVFRGAR